MKKVLGKAAGSLFKSHSSRRIAIASTEGSAKAAASGPTTESRENSAPASRNVVEVARKFDDILCSLGRSICQSACSRSCQEPDPKLPLPRLTNAFQEGGFPVDQSLLDTLKVTGARYPEYSLAVTHKAWDW